MNSKELRAKLDEMGVSFTECVMAFDDPAEADTVERAQQHRLCSEGELEVDGITVVSRGDDNGAYVMAWLWVEDPDSDEEEGDD